MSRDTGSSSGRGYRSLAVKVKTARGRKVSSTQWLRRHLNDPYVQRSQLDGYRSRAAYKLLEINDKYDLLKKGMRVVDLGCAPGGWSQVAAKEVGSHDQNTLVAGIDYLGMDPIPGVAILEKNFLDDDAPKLLNEALGGHSVDLVMSDMAAPTIGHKQTDHLRIVQLCEISALFARDNLKTGGDFIAKVFQGGTEKNLLDALRKEYTKVGHFKPPASRKDSPETYLIALGFKGKEALNS